MVWWTAPAVVRVYAARNVVAPAGIPIAPARSVVGPPTKKPLPAPVGVLDGPPLREKHAVTGDGAIGGTSTGRPDGADGGVGCAGVATTVHWHI